MITGLIVTASILFGLFGLILLICALTGGQAEGDRPGDPN
jgi:hypothetical protein